MNALRFNSFALAAIGFAATLGASASAQSASPSGPRVVVETGVLEGRHTADGDQFLNVPFAAPPVGKLRWSPPSPVERWVGVKPVKAYGPVCPQDRGIAALGAKFRVTGAEDCLHLDIYRPSGASRDLPVIIWIHGGNSIIGDSSDISGAPLARSAGAVVISINYRLGALGYLTLPQLDQESSKGTSGNYGLLDQRAAIQWVHRNVRAFGGDPTNITVIGQSAGGWATWVHLGSPETRPLIRRAIVLSGLIALDGTKEAEQASGASPGLVVATGCDSQPDVMACLRRQPAEAVVEKGVFPWKSGRRWRMIVDGVVLQQTILAASKSYIGTLPIMAQGTAAEAGNLVRFRHGNGEPVWGAAEFDAYLARIPDSAAIRAKYPIGSFKDGDAAYIQIVTDERTCEIVRMRELAGTKGRVLLSEFDDPNASGRSPNEPEPKTGAFHGADIQYVFQTAYPQWAFPAGVPFTAEQFALSKRMMARVGAFARGQLDRSASDMVTVFRPGADTQETVAMFSARHQCDFWRTLEPTLYLQ